MTDINKKNAKNLGIGDLILLCEQSGIKVTQGDNASSLREKLAPKKPKPKSKS